MIAKLLETIENLTSHKNCHNCNTSAKKNQLQQRFWNAKIKEYTSGATTVGHIINNLWFNNKFW